jgi:hypothetical protein
MDSSRLDVLARFVGDRATRRAMLGLSGAMAVLGVSDAAAKKRKKKKKCKTCPLCRTCRKGKCSGKQPDGTDCDNGRSCQNGACVCLPAERACDEFCCAEGLVCDADRQQCANPGACAPVTELACVGADVSCNGSASCACLKDVDDATHCGAVPAQTGCNLCVDNQDCVELTGNAQAFCVESGSNGCCGPGQTFCRIPCPA